MKFLIIIVYLLISTLSFSQHDHSGHSHDNSDNLVNHPPHNGVVEKAGKYYIEVVTNWMQKDNNTTIYLLNYNGKIITKKKMSCKVSIINDEENIEVETYEIKDVCYKTHLDFGDSMRVQVIFYVNNTKYTAMFFTKGF